MNEYIDIEIELELELARHAVRGKEEGSFN
jgi:hypothetical protein